MVRQSLCNFDKNSTEGTCPLTVFTLRRLWCVYCRERCSSQERKLVPVLVDGHVRREREV